MALHPGEPPFPYPLPLLAILLPASPEAGYYGAAFSLAIAAMALFGWLVQMTMGVGYWILPKHPTGAARGAAWSPWFTLGCLNIGIFLAAAEPWLPGIGAAGLAIIAVGVIAFLATVLPRVKAFGVGC